MGLAKLASLVRFNARQHCQREHILRVRERAFRALLPHAWHHSPCYRDYYSTLGIREADLAEIPIDHLPFTHKKIIMDNLNQVVTHAELKRNQIEAWLKINDNPRDFYLNRYMVIHTSRSSGEPSIVVYDKKA